MVVPGRQVGVLATRAARARRHSGLPVRDDDVGPLAEEIDPHTGELPRRSSGANG
jgi:hypothetical protein